MKTAHAAFRYRDGVTNNQYDTEIVDLNVATPGELLAAFRGLPNNVRK